jgi:hypothetical protein
MKKEIVFAVICAISTFVWSLNPILSLFTASVAMRRSKALHLVALLIAVAMIVASLPFAAALKLNVGVSSGENINYMHVY